MWLCRCQFRGDLDTVTNALFECCLPLVYQLLHVFREQDDVSRECMLLLRDTAEVQLPSMGSTTARSLYITSLEAFRIFALRFHTTPPASSASNGLADGSGGNDSFESEFRSDILLNCLELLNHLVTKDLQLEEVAMTSSKLLQPPTSPSLLSPTGAPLTTSSASLIPEVLLTGLEIVLSVITPDLLKSFPRTADRYFTFLTLLTSAYEKELAERMSRSVREAAVTGSGGSNMLALLIQHMLWAAGAIDSAAARLALQV